MADAELVFEGVRKVFGEGSGEEVAAVDGIDLSVEKGQLVSFLGPSGCGKTTSLRLIAGFEYATSGTIRIRGQRVNDVPPQKRDTAMVFQSYGLFPHMTVFQNVAYGLQVQHVGRRETRRRVGEALARLGLDGLGNRSTAALSGGQQQRVALARALVTEPTVLLFDEPLSNLDAKLRRGTREEIRHLQTELGITSIYVTHDQEEAMSISDRVVIMNAGRIEQTGEPMEVYARPRTRFVADFIGDANFCPGTVRDAGAGQVAVELYGGVLEIPRHPDDPPLKPSQAVDVVVRPEAVDLVDEGEGDVDATVSFSHYTGSVVSYTLQLQGGSTLVAEAFNPLERGIRPAGTRCGVHFHRRSLHVLAAES